MGIFFPISPVERLRAQVEVLQRMESEFSMEVRRADRRAARLDREATVLYNNSRKRMQTNEDQLRSLLERAERERMRASRYSTFMQTISDNITDFKIQSGMVETQQASTRAMESIIRFARQLPASVLQQITMEYSRHMDIRVQLEEAAQDARSDATDSITDPIEAGESAKETVVRRVDERLQQLRDQTALDMFGAMDADVPSRAGRQSGGSRVAASVRSGDNANDPNESE